MLLILLAIVLTFALFGCAGSDEPESEDANTEAGQVATEPAEEAAEPATAAEDLLTIADVEGVMGVSGVTLLPYDPSTGAGGKLNFAGTDGNQVLLYTDASADLWDDSKNATGMFLEDVTGLGDEAYIGPDTSIAALPYTLTVRSGDTMFTLASFFNVAAGGTPYLTIDQLKELGAIVVSRL